MRKLIPTGYTHVKMGGPPTDWAELMILNTDTQTLVYQVIEVNTEEGWLERHVDTVPDGSLDEWPSERLEGNFQIVRAAEIESTSHVRKEDSAG